MKRIFISCLILGFLGFIFFGFRGLTDYYKNPKTGVIKLFEQESISILKEYSFQMFPLSKPSPVKLMIYNMDQKQTFVFDMKHILSDIKSNGTEICHCDSLSLDSNGFLIGPEGNKNIYFTTGFGESVVLIIESIPEIFSQPNAWVLPNFIPHPLKTLDCNGHHLSIRSNDNAGLEFYLELSGFNPNETVNFLSKSCNEETTNVIPMNENGRATILYTPGVINEVEGPFSLSFSNENTNLFLQHYWGQIAFTPPNEYDQLKEKFPQFFEDELNKLAEKGDAEAQCLLGSKNLEQNQEKAVYWLEKSALQGYPKAQFFLGASYLEGLGVEKSLDKALYWLEKAAENNDGVAQFFLGLLFFKGEDIAQDYNRALTWFQKSSLQDNAEAQYHLGYMHLSGFGTPKNNFYAANYFKKAALKEHACAQLDLGIMFMNGEGIKQDYPQGLKWVEKSAGHGNASAQSYLGKIYYDGYGVQKDPKISFYWLSQAAKKGNEKAIQALKKYSFKKTDKNWNPGLNNLIK